MNSTSVKSKGKAEVSLQSSSLDGIDAHCHVFNLKFILKEIKKMLFDWLTGEYPREIIITKEKPEPKKEKKIFIQKLIRMAEMLSATVHSEKTNFRFIQEEAKAAWGITIGAIPLMMDIYYFFAPPVTEKDTKVFVPKGPILKRSVFNEDEFEKEFEKELQKLGKKLKKTNKTLYGTKSKPNEIEKYIKDSVEDKEYKFVTKSRDYGKLKLTNGFRFHLERLKELVEEGEPVFPFFAADPRRPGIFNTLKNEKLISKNGPFYGVKLYPRLGYHPASKPMQDIFQICIDRDLPVITHTGMGGFPPKEFSLDGSKLWKYNDYGNPIHYVAALEKGLRIDFAHLGSTDPDFIWANTIVDFMEKYENVYSDLSCYTSREELQEIIKRYGSNPFFRKKIMYGSDYDVIYFTDKTISLEQYCRNFSDLFPGEIENMRKRNVINFLKLEI